MSNQIATETYYKAQSLAHWSYIGLLFPLIGVILGSMSRSRLRMLTGATYDEQAALDHTRKVAAWGFGLSVTLLIVQIVAGIAWGAMIGYYAAQMQ